MNPAIRPIALAALAAGQAGVAHAAVALTPTLAPGFSCASSTDPGAGGSISWQGVSLIDAPTIGYIDSLGVYGNESKIDCADHKLAEAVARKAGDGQKDFLKVTMKEVFISSLSPGTGENDFKWRATQVLGSLDGKPVYETYFEILRQFEPTTEGSSAVRAFLGFKFVSFGAFNGLDKVGIKYEVLRDSPDIFLKTDTPYGLLTLTVPTQEQEGVVMSLTASPNDVPEPGTLALLGTGLLGAAAVRRRRRGW